MSLLRKDGVGFDHEDGASGCARPGPIRRPEVDASRSRPEGASSPSGDGPSREESSTAWRLSRLFKRGLRPPLRQGQALRLKAKAVLSAYRLRPAPSPSPFGLWRITPAHCRVA